MRGFVALTVSVVFAAGGAAAQSAPAAGTPFQRGDVFLSRASGVQEYSPSGQLQQTVSRSSGATVLCFDPSGEHLILPGVGLFDSWGSRLESNWASVANVSRCVADGFGHVYLNARSSSGWTITKYDLSGDLLQTFNIDALALPPLAMDLAPDECTMYYGELSSPNNKIGRFNVCTNTQGTPFGERMLDDLRVLPNWQALVSYDRAGFLLDTSGQLVQTYRNPSGFGQLGSESLDPDGSSFWMCCDHGSVLRWDISSGRLLADWSGSGEIAVYGPPLLGNASVARTVDSNPAGTAEAFVTRVGYSGQLSRLHLWVDFSPTASQVIVGIYSNNNGHPGALQEQRTITNVMPGGWNYVNLRSMSVTAGRRYWIAVLDPRDGGTIRFREALTGRGSETSVQHNLTALPAKWSTGKTWPTAHLSAYGS